MIVGIGTDIVEVARFIPWITAPHKQLTSIFSEQEIIDCIISGAQAQQIAEKLAARFAAKEALYKALSAALVSLHINPDKTFSFMFAAQHVSVVLSPLGTPLYSVNWQPLYEKIGQPLPQLTLHLSLAHEKTQAIAFTVISLYKEC